MKGLCDNCGSVGVLHTCALCGRRVCSNCLVPGEGICRLCLRRRRIKR